MDASLARQGRCREFIDRYLGRPSCHWPSCPLAPPGLPPQTRSWRARSGSAAASGTWKPPLYQPAHHSVGTVHWITRCTRVSRLSACWNCRTARV